MIGTDETRLKQFRTHHYYTSELQKTKVATAVAQEPISKRYISRFMNIASLIDRISIYSRLATPIDREKMEVKVLWLPRTKLLVWVHLLLSRIRFRIGGLCCRRLSLLMLEICGMGCVRCRLSGLSLELVWVRCFNMRYTSGISVASLKRGMLFHLDVVAERAHVITIASAEGLKLQ